MKQNLNCAGQVPVEKVQILCSYFVSFVSTCLSNIRVMLCELLQEKLNVKGAEHDSEVTCFRFLIAMQIFLVHPSSGSECILPFNLFMPWGASKD
jgi:hypothetical protein